MGNYMSAKGVVVTGILAAGFIGFIVGVSSYDMVYNVRGGQPLTWSYFGACDSGNAVTQNCYGLTLDFIHCQRGETPGSSSFIYHNMFTSTASPWIDAAGGVDSNGLDVPSCRSMIAAEAFGVMAIIFSFFGFIGAVVHEKGRLGGGFSAVLASLCGVIALAVFFSVKPENFNNLRNPTTPPQNKDIADYVDNGNLALGYSTGFQVVGIIASFFGGILAFMGDFGPTGGASSSSSSSSSSTANRPAAATHHPQSSTVGITGAPTHHPQSSTAGFTQSAYPQTGGYPPSGAYPQSGYPSQTGYTPQYPPTANAGATEMH